jgi:hypothetical protein
MTKTFKKKKGLKYEWDGWIWFKWKSERDMKTKLKTELHRNLQINIYRGMIASVTNYDSSQINIVGVHKWNLSNLRSRNIILIDSSYRISDKHWFVSPLWPFRPAYSTFFSFLLHIHPSFFFTIFSRQSINFNSQIQNALLLLI